MKSRVMIAPSILSADFAAMGNAVEKLEKCGADLDSLRCYGRNVCAAHHIRLADGRSREKAHLSSAGRASDGGESRCQDRRFCRSGGGLHHRACGSLRRSACRNAQRHPCGGRKVRRGDQSRYPFCGGGRGFGAVRHLSRHERISGTRRAEIHRAHACKGGRGKERCRQAWAFLPRGDRRRHHRGKCGGGSPMRVSTCWWREILCSRLRIWPRRSPRSGAENAGRDPPQRRAAPRARRYERRLRHLL